MERVILQPAGSADATKHYHDTIENFVSLERISSHGIGDHVLTRLKELYPSGETPVWGVVPGTNNGNFKKWQKVSPGDVVVFCGDGKIFASGVVTCKAHSKPLALDLWGTDSKGATWEYLYFLDEIQSHNIPYAKLNAAAGYAPNNVVQGFNVLDPEKSSRILAYLDLASPTFYHEVSEKDFESAVRKINNSPLDTEQKVLARTEQAFLRNRLFADRRVASCCICGDLYPVEFLVAAHIKKRSECTDDEKRDYKHIVAPMCKFGCDDLYEKGYLGVVDGQVRIYKNSTACPTVQSRLTDLSGRDCVAWKDGTKKYFRWHQKHFSRK